MQTGSAFVSMEMDSGKGKRFTGFTEPNRRHIMGNRKWYMFNFLIQIWERERVKPTFLSLSIYVSFSEIYLQKKRKKKSDFCDKCLKFWVKKKPIWTKLGGH